MSAKPVIVRVPSKLGDVEVLVRHEDHGVEVDVRPWGSRMSWTPIAVKATDSLLDELNRQVAQKGSAQAGAWRATDLLDRLHSLVQHYGLLTPADELLPLLDEIRAFLLPDSGGEVLSRGEAGGTSPSASDEGDDRG